MSLPERQGEVACCDVTDYGTLRRDGTRRLYYHKFNVKEVKSRTVNITRLPFLVVFIQYWDASFALLFHIYRILPFVVG